MAKSRKKIGLRGVIALCVALFIAGYLVGSFFPLPAFDESSFLGAMRRPGGNTHRR